MREKVQEDCQEKRQEESQATTLAPTREKQIQHYRPRWFRDEDELFAKARAKEYAHQWAGKQRARSKRIRHFKNGFAEGIQYAQMEYGFSNGEQT